MSRIEHLAEGVTLYLGDCHEIARTLKFDAVVSDPPYGINYTYHGGGSGAGEGKPAARSSSIVGDDKKFDPSPWLGVPCVFFGADYFSRSLPDGGRWLVWDKRRNVTPPRSQSDCELAWCSVPGPRRICYHLWDGFVRDSEVGVKREHPTQKPIAVKRWAIQQTGVTGTILDPFMGSGSTGIAAVGLGCKFIGIEIEPKYFDIACRRIDAVVRQGDIFALSPPERAES